VPFTQGQILHRLAKLVANFRESYVLDEEQGKGGKSPTPQKKFFQPKNISGLLI